MPVVWQGLYLVGRPWLRDVPCLAQSHSWVITPQACSVNPEVVFLSPPFYGRGWKHREASNLVPRSHTELISSRADVSPAARPVPTQLPDSDALTSGRVRAQHP